MKQTLISLGLILSVPAFSLNEWTLSNPETEGWVEFDKANLYFHNSDMQRLWARHGLTKIKIKTGDKILDFGSGPGTISAELSFDVPNGEVVGVDISSSMIDFAQRKYPQEFFPKLSFAVSEDSEFSKFPLKNHFDHAVSFCAFHLIPNPLVVLKNLKASLKSDGTLLLVYPVFWKEVLDARAAVFQVYKLPLSSRPSTQFNMRTKVDAIETLASAGFAVEEFEFVMQRYNFVTADEFLQWTKGTLSANWNIPRSIENEVFFSFMEEYSKRDPKVKSESVAFSFPAHYFIIKAKAVDQRTDL